MTSTQPTQVSLNLPPSPPPPSREKILAAHILSFVKFLISVKNLFCFPQGAIGAVVREENPQALRQAFSDSREGKTRDTRNLISGCLVWLVGLQSVRVLIRAFKPSRPCSIDFLGQLQYQSFLSGKGFCFSNQSVTASSLIEERQYMQRALMQKGKIRNCIKATRSETPDFRRE